MQQVPPAGAPPARPIPPLGKQKKLSVLDLQHKTRKGTKITMVTAYDYPSALHVDLAGIDIILCGDSVAMVELGYPTTQPVDMEQMLHHCKAVARGTKRSLIVGDMPFGSYEVTEEMALMNAIRFVKEVSEELQSMLRCVGLVIGAAFSCLHSSCLCYQIVPRRHSSLSPDDKMTVHLCHVFVLAPKGFVDAVKIEGGRDRASTVNKIIRGGVAVMGHVGLTPQAISVLGGFRAQGR